MPPTPPKPADVRVSLRDIADAVGVSHVTVSLALRGDSRISATRRAEVAAAAERLGYRPDPMLSSLAAYRQTKRTAEIRSTVAWLNQWTRPHELRSFQEFDAYWRGAEAYATQLGYRLEEYPLGPDMSAARIQQILLARNVRGILLPPHTLGLSMEGFDWSQFSVVRLGISVKHPRGHIVTSDQLNCAAMAYAKLWEKGYRRIAYVSAHRFDLNTGGNFRAGFLSAQDIHVPLDQHLAPLLFGEAPNDPDVGTLKAWLQRHQPDALITTLGPLHTMLKEAGFQVPKDLGVAALSLLDGHFDSGVDQNSVEVGRVAMATLAALIQQNERGIPQFCRRILVEGRWVDGSSAVPQPSRPSAPTRAPRPKRKRLPAA